MSDDTITKCDKCEEMYPTIIFTCRDCYTEVATARGFKDKTPCVYFCFECWQKLNEKVWLYDHSTESIKGTR